MRGALDFEVDEGGLLRLPFAIQQRLDKLSPAAQFELLDDIATYIERTTQRRLNTQTDAQGRAFLPRKHKNWNGEQRPAAMLMRMKELSVSVQNGRVMVGYQRAGGRAALARWHNEGKRGRDDRKQRPRRQWLDLSPADIKAINQLIMKFLSNH